MSHVDAGRDPRFVVGECGRGSKCARAARGLPRLPLRHLASRAHRAVRIHAAIYTVVLYYYVHLQTTLDAEIENLRQVGNIP